VVGGSLGGRYIILRSRACGQHSSRVARRVASRLGFSDACQNTVKRRVVALLAGSLRSRARDWSWHCTNARKTAAATAASKRERERARARERERERKRKRERGRESARAKSAAAVKTAGPLNNVEPVGNRSRPISWDLNGRRARRAPLHARHVEARGRPGRFKGPVRDAPKFHACVTV